MIAAPALCACSECRALDAEFPNEGRQLALIANRVPAAPAQIARLSSSTVPRQAMRPRPTAALWPAGDSPSICRRTPMTITSLTIGDLCVSPYNVRTNQVDANAIVGMADSLYTRGQLYPLVVHPMPGSRGKKKQWGVIAGGRRYRAFSLLITQGKLPTGHGIDVLVRDITDEGELRDLSLAENINRVDLRDYEKFAAVATAHSKGRSFQEIADTNGQTLRTIREWNRLGSLEPSIFTALEEGRISTSHAMAFGATDDHAMQLHAFTIFMQRGDRDQPHAPRIIRNLLKVGDSEQTKLLHFVGEKTYTDAGGHYELDLFADQAEERGCVRDEGLLMQLVEAKLERTRALLRQQVHNHTPGRILRFEAKPPPNNVMGGYVHDLEISPDEATIDPADAERAAYIQDEMLELVSRAEVALANHALDDAAKADAIAAIDADLEPLEIEQTAIDARRALALPDGDIFATLEIEQDGSLEQRFWWASRKAKRDAEKPAAPTRPVSAGPIPKVEAEAAQRVLMPKPANDGAAIDQSYGFSARQMADAAIKDEFGATADAVQVLRSLRREVLRCALLDDAEGNGEWGRDYAIWCLLRFELAGGIGHQLGARRLSGGHEAGVAIWDVVRPHVKRSIAGMRWERETADLRAHASMMLKDLPSAFTAFYDETSVWKNKVAAYLAGLMLERSLNAPGYQVPLHDMLAAQTGLRDPSIAGYVETTEELVELFPRAQRLALARSHVDQTAFAAWAKLKASDLTAPITRALRKAKSWVHPLMQFQPSPAPTEVREAAE